MNCTDSKSTIRRCMSILRDRSTEACTILPNNMKAAEFAHSIIMYDVLNKRKITKKQNQKTKKPKLQKTKKPKKPKNKKQKTKNKNDGEEME